jgi:xanthine dehydrogenase YagR molybdenum-binding subunit
MSIQELLEKVQKKVVALAPDALIPGSTPDPLLNRPHQHIGRAQSRLDGPEKVEGKAQFAAEFLYDGMLFGALAFSTIARGHISALDTSAAEAAPGVVAVMTYRNALRMKPPALFGSSPTAAGPSDLPVMQDDRIHWNGQPVAVAFAETQEQADHAAALVHCSFEIEAPITVFEQAKAHAHPPQSILGEPPQLVIGKPEKALQSAEVRVDQIYRTPRHNHNAIEPHAATAIWDGNRLLVHDASQLVSATAATLADIFGLQRSEVRVTSPFVGGGFGGKCLWWHQILAAAGSKLTGRPVRIALSREGVFRLVGGRTCTEQRVALGADRDGKLAALIHTGVVAMTRHNNCPEQFTFPARHLYAAENFHIAQQVADMNMVANTFMRAPGESVGTFALESAIDEMAEALKLDPIEFRRRIEPTKDPTSRLPFSSRHILKAYEDGAIRFAWSKRQAPGAHREGDWLVGLGVATATYPYHRMPGAKARLTLTKAGEVRAEVPAHEMGMGTATAQCLVLADRFAVPFEQVSFAYGDSAFAGAVLAGGSQQTAAIGAAVRAAHESLVGKLLALVAPGSQLGELKTPEYFGARDSGLYRLDDPSCWQSYSDILEQAGHGSLTVEADAPPPLELAHWSMHSYGAMFCEARVNAITGEIRIARFLGSFDCGRILNPKTAASQFRGGIVMGLGLALMEETEFDERNGRIMNRSLAEYHVPVHLDAPAIDVIWTDIPDPHSPMGAHGVGEIGITGVGAAVANAVYNATGCRVRELPLTLDKLLPSLPTG